MAENVDTLTHPDQELAIWYPAVEEGQRTMTLRDYIKLTQRSHPSKLTADEKIALFQRYPLRLGATQDKLNKVLDQPLMAQMSAEPQPSQWPVVVLLGSIQAAYWSPTAEHLASLGFVVMAIPSFRHPVDELSNIDRALDMISAMPYVDNSSIGIVGYSTSGINALLLQMRDDKVKAVVTLEGSDTQSLSMREANHLELEKHPKFNPDRPAPLCVIYSGRGSYGQEKGYSTNFSFYDQTSNPYILMEFPNLHHEGGTGLGYFGDMEPRLITQDSTFNLKQDYLQVREVISEFMVASLTGNSSDARLNQVFGSKTSHFKLRPYTLNKAVAMIEKKLKEGENSDAMNLIQEALNFYPNSSRLLRLKDQTQ